MSEMVLVKSRTVYICAAIMVCGMVGSLDRSVISRRDDPLWLPTPIGGVKCKKYDRSDVDARILYMGFFWIVVG